MRLEGRTAIVTGAGSGIGRSIATELAAEGADVAIGDVEEEPNLPDETVPTHRKIRETDGKAIFVKCDVSSNKDARSLVEEAIDTFDEIDILVNNAGIFPSGSIEEMAEETWDRTFDVNVKGIYNMSSHALSHLRESDAPRIINMSSQLGLVGLAEASAYCGSKGAVANLTRQMAIDYADENITVNAINPGVIETSMTRPQLDDPEQREEIERNTLLPFVGDPEDIGRAAVFLASDDARFVTGHCLVVDGGWTAH